jgi:hypothetical protein
MPGFRNDPRWITAKYPASCAHQTKRDLGSTLCNMPIPRGARAFYFPATRSIYCAACGEGAARDFQAFAFDDDLTAAGYGSW